MSTTKPRDIVRSAPAAMGLSISLVSSRDSAVLFRRRQKYHTVPRARIRIQTESTAIPMPILAPAERSLAERFLGGAVVGVVGAAVAGVVVAVVDGIDVLDCVDAVANVEVSDVVVSCRTLPIETDKIDEDCESTMGVVGNAADRGRRWPLQEDLFPLASLERLYFLESLGPQKSRMSRCKIRM